MEIRLREVKNIKEITFYSDSIGILALKAKFYSHHGAVMEDKIQGTENIEKLLDNLENVIQEKWENKEDDKITSIYCNYEPGCVKSIKFTTLLHNVLSIGVDKFNDKWFSSNFEFFAKEEIVGMDSFFKGRNSI